LYTSKLADMGIFIHRNRNLRGGIKPHLSVRFRSDEGKIKTFAVDTSRTTSKEGEPDLYLITHAHSDHFGKSAMISQNSVCTEETARALEIRYKREFLGKKVGINDSFLIKGVNVKTCPVYHTAGSNAFFWENENGVRILVTGDVKEASDLPKCDVLITEANYGDPNEPSCYFNDDLENIKRIIYENIGYNKIAFGAYDFGKSQKVVEILRYIGYKGPIAMNKITYALTSEFVENAGDLVPINVKERMSTKKAADISIVPPNKLTAVGSNFKKYVLTCRDIYPYPSIRISDHLDVRGLDEMVKKCSPEVTITYHPNTGDRPEKYAQHLRTKGYDAFSLSEIKNIL